MTQSSEIRLFGTRRARLLALGTLLGLGALALAASGAVSDAMQPTLTGDLQIHDPTVMRIGSGYVALGTGYENVDGGTLRIKTSPDGLNWKDAGHLGDRQPAWVAKLLGQNPPNLWAPNIGAHGGTTFLYFAASTFGKNLSGIGLYTHPAFDPNKPAKGWVDRGLVLSSKPGDNFNAIDPYRVDTSDGKAWLAFGSFWDGIKMRELDPTTGLLNTRNSTLYSLASRGGGAIEAAAILQHGDYYYLLVSFDRCCAGLSSTYRIMMGRSRAVTGPYADRAGVPMMRGGGTQLQAGQGRFIGPGGQEFYRDASSDRLVYHYYDRDQGGVSQLQTSPISWDADGWPVLGRLPGGTP